MKADAAGGRVIERDQPGDVEAGAARAVQRQRAVLAARPHQRVALAHRPKIEPRLPAAAGSRVLIYVPSSSIAMTSTSAAVRRGASMTNSASTSEPERWSS